MREADTLVTAETDQALLMGAVADAGALALSYFGNGPKQWAKADDSPISEADIAVNDLLHERLQGERPDYGWLSEESADDQSRLSRRRVWGGRSNRWYAIIPQRRAALDRCGCPG